MQILHIPAQLLRVVRLTELYAKCSRIETPHSLLTWFIVNLIQDHNERGLKNTNMTNRESTTQSPQTKATNTKSSSKRQNTENHVYDMYQNNTNENDSYFVLKHAKIENRQYTGLASNPPPPQLLRPSSQISHPPSSGEKKSFASMEKNNQPLTDKIKLTQTNN